MSSAKHFIIFGAAASSAFDPLQTLPWPDCMTRGKILRNNETNAVFADLRPLGGMSGCWEDNCGSSDKVRVLSIEHCAATCAKIPDCNYWTLLDDLCYFRASDDTTEDLEEAMFGERLCAPKDTIFTVDVPHAQAALMAAQNTNLQTCANNLEECNDVYGAIATFAYILQQFKQAVLIGGKDVMKLMEDTSRYADSALTELNFVLAKDDPPKEEIEIVITNAVTLIMEVSEWLSEQPIVPVDRNDLSMPLPILGYFCQRYTCYPPAELTAMPEFSALQQQIEEARLVVAKK